MIQLNRVYDSTSLKSDATYQIDGCLYRFLYKDPYSSVNAPRYKFQAWVGQRRRSDLILNHRQLTSKVYEVEGMLASRNVTATDAAVQLSLF